MITRNKTSIHHIIPVSRGGKNNNDNKVRLPANFHRRWHDLFREMTPDEVILFIKLIMTPGEDWNYKRMESLYYSFLGYKSPYDY